MISFTRHSVTIFLNNTKKKGEGKEEIVFFLKKEKEKRESNGLYNMNDKEKKREKK